MEHSIVSFFGTLLLPVVLVAVLASMVGIKPEAILMPVFGLVGVVLKVVLDLAIVVVRLAFGGALALIARIFNVR